MKHNMWNFQEKVLKEAAGKINEFYLGGGTALSLYYFHHRESLDLDFFTQKFNMLLISNIIRALSIDLKKKIELVKEQKDKKKVKLAVYSIQMSNTETLKIDFIEDCINLIKSPKLINGINVLSLEDIYIRKIYAITGTSTAQGLIGRNIFQDGRQEAKDFYDLYCLSNIFRSLSNFSSEYCTPLLREGIIRWFRTYNRLDIKSGLLELKLNKEIDYKEIESHFKKEIDEILEKEVRHR